MHDMHFQQIIPKFSSIKKGSQLTLERLRKLKLGDGLSDEEKDVFYEMLYNRECHGALTYDSALVTTMSLAPGE